MRDIILITNPGYGIDKFDATLRKNMSNFHIVSDRDEVSLEFKSKGELFGDWVKIRKEENIEQDYEPKDMNRILEVIPKPEFYFIYFKDIGHAKIVLKFIADRSDLLVDNNHGLILPGNEFVKLCEERPDWDWAYNNV